MASLEYPPQTATNIAAAGTVTVKFTYPIPSTTDSTTTIPELVQVTGTFNAWQRSQPLTCNQDRTLFEADISIDIASLPQGSDNSNSSKMQKEDPSRKKILFKFVLDGQNWVTDPDQPTERDYAGNLNNVLFVDISTATTATITTDTKEAVSTPSAVTETKTEAETETEEERAARLKQEEEDEETIRQLGGGMWGAPFFAVNDPIALPEHFTPADDAAENKEVSTVPLTTTTASKEQEKEAEASVAAVAQNVVEGGASIQSVVQETKPTPILADSISESSSSSTPEQQRQPEEHKVEGKKGEEVEDEDDRIIKELGGGMWGTPFFKVNDPAALPEHFQEALSASTSSSVPVVETVTDKDGDSPRHSIQIVKDEITTKIEGGTLFETVVETTEDIVIEAADGTFLEESITTSVEETVSGVIDEEVTEIIETIEEEEAPAAAANTKVVVEDEGAIKFVETVEEQTDDNKIPAGASTPEVTMTETETTTLVQGEDGVETTIVEDTLTFTDGPEVDASSLHSLTTVTKPVTDGESVAVEQAPEVLVENSVAAVASPGDAKPSVDESVEPLPSLSSATTATTTITTTTTATGLSTPSNEQQESDSVVLLSSQKPQEVVAGDAKPTADLSVATTVLTPNLIVDTKSTLPNHLTSAAPTAFTTTETAATTTVAPTTEKSGKTEKGEKRKSFWKKVKKVLS
ncbi:hypothetical protein BGX29_001895 [Mortierella sp. GBA35]|nr:hypothetical protein BGX29_001895 [Mortierella sp. GBA35]KAG0216033.1 hypothetical protein BGX33_000552 [Mortierella sp. NVP41]